MGDLEDELAGRLAADRLRGLSGWAGGLLALGGLLVAAAMGDGWPGWGPSVVGVTVAAAAWLSQRPGVLAAGVLASVAGLALSVWTSLAWALPLSHPQAPMAVVVALALAATVSGVSARARGGLLVAAGLVGVVQVAPWTNDGPYAALGDALRLAWMRPSVAYTLRLICVVPFVVWPLVLVGVGEWVRRKRGSLSSLSRVALGSPLLLLGATTRALEGSLGAGGASLARDAGEAMVLGAIAVLASVALGWMVSRERVRRGDPKGLWAPCLAAVIALAPVAQIERAPAPLAWAAGGPTLAGEELFGALLPSWNDQRANQDLHAQGDSAAAAERAVTAARAIDEGLGRAVSALVAGASSKELTLSRWEQLVGAVNAVSARRGLPYYVDPAEGVQQVGEPGRTWFRLNTYRLEAVHRWQASDGGVASVLLLRRLAPGRGGHPVLGMSRDGQPFALLLTDEIDALAADLARLGSQPSPRCSERRHGDAMFEAAMARCGQVLATMPDAEALRAMLQASVERHEAQHQLDGARLRRSPLVRRRLVGVEPSLQREVNRELSAYLAELTGEAPTLALARLLRLSTIHRGPVEATAARLALEALDSEPMPAALHFAALAALEPDALRARARQAWRQQYGRNLQEVGLR